MTSELIRNYAEKYQIKILQDIDQVKSVLCVLLQQPCVTLHSCLYHMIMYVASHDPYILSHDVLYHMQLNNERRKQTVFTDFIEGPIDFKPSYKYEPNTDNWDSR